MDELDNRRVRLVVGETPLLLPLPLLLLTGLPPPVRFAKKDPLLMLVLPVLLLPLAEDPAKALLLLPSVLLLIWFWTTGVLVLLST